MRQPFMKTLALAAAIALPTLLPGQTQAAPERYLIDTEGAHAFIQFRIKHLGYSWLYGRFNDFGGSFTYDPDDPGASQIQVDIKTASLDSNHAERDKHLRSNEFLDVGKHPTASFKSSSYKETGPNKGALEGELTLKGVTKPIKIDVEMIGNGPDPWGGYRRGFEGRTELTLKDFGFDDKLGPASGTVQMMLSVEGIRQ